MRICNTSSPRFYLTKVWLLSFASVIVSEE